MSSADEGILTPATRTVWFAHWLRAGSVVLVVFGHLGRTFWERNDLAVALAHVRPLPESTLSGVPSAIADHDTLYAAGLTVAVGFFFLISGFLIPLTMDGKTVGRFLLNRVCRIYPVWIVSLLLIAAVFAIQQWAADVPINTSVAAWASNAATVPDLARQPTLNPPGWTLFVEVKWYLFCALAMATFGLSNAWVVAGAAASLTLYAAMVWQGLESLADASPGAWAATQALAWDAPHLCMILVGLCAYNRLRSHWSVVRTLTCAGICLAAMTTTSWLIDDGDAFRAPKYVSYVLAVAGFALAYAYRDRFRPNRMIQYLADMSFSLYVVHFVLGMVLIDRLVRATHQPLASTIGAVVVVVAVAAALHRFIEMPGIRFGKHWRTQSVKKPVG